MLQSVRVQANPHNAISAIVGVTAHNAAQIAVELSVESQFAGRTPWQTVGQPNLRLPVLGLRPNSQYVMRVVAASISGDTTRSVPLTFATGALPADLPRLTVAANQSPQPGYVMLGFPNAAGDATMFYALIIDNHGTVVWYRGFPSPVVDFQKQPDGGYTLFSSLDAAPPHFLALDILGDVYAEFRASSPLTTGPHELRRIDGGYVLFAIEQRTLDLSGHGGQAAAQVRGTHIEWQRGDGSLFSWSPYDHFSVADAADIVPIDGAYVNPWHGNAIDIDRDGNLLVSFRNLDEITKIDARTGEIIWRLGGKSSDFAFSADPLGGFSHQHAARRLANGNLLLFDNGNGHDPPQSRAVEYRLDEQNRTAELEWEYRHQPPIFGFALGFAQRLANGHTLINYGTAQRVLEVDAAGAIHWDLRFAGAGDLPYRAIRIESLY